MEKLESLLCTADNVKWCSCCRKCYDFLNVLYTEVSYDPEILLLDVYLKEMKAGMQTGICTPMFTVQYPQQPKGGSNTVSTNISKIWYIHTMLLSLKRKEILTHAAVLMNLGDSWLSKRSQSHEDKYYTFLLTKGPWNSQIQRESRLVIARGWEE